MASTSDLGASRGFSRPPRKPPVTRDELVGLAVGVGRLRVFGLTAWDLIFVAFGWLTLFYAVAIIAQALRTGDWEIDYMPIVAGVPFILVGWRAVRVNEQVIAAIERLDDDAGLVLAEGDSFDAVKAELGALVRRRQIVVAAGLGLLMAGVLAALVQANEIAAIGSGLIYLLGAVLIGVGAALGVLVGSLWGNGQVLDVLDRRKAHFAGVLTRETRRTLARLASVFRFGFVATTILCQWFAVWFLGWLLGLWGTTYRELFIQPFIVLMIVSLVIFLLAGFRPFLSFLGRLNALYGGAGAAQGIRRQVEQARLDLSAETDPAARHDLTAFIAEKEADPIARGLLTRAFAWSVLAWNGLCLAGGLFVLAAGGAGGQKAALLHLLAASWS
ncbi:hypothetical protein V5F29_05305 [Xanthobacter aminoxidans]|uniref:hypothetical protein n=1 Tax=Xanthobacter aminoxidans TaxID=186280 RepID=UPI003726F62D